jgi:protein-S-isoprenylcysteine O-methyltransferase Ste14
MTIAVIVGILILLGALWVFLFLARRAMRWAVRLALLGIVLLALLVGGIAWWWYGASETATPQRERTAPATRRGNSR